LLRTSRRWFPFIERVFADTAYAGERVANATRIIVEIVRKVAGVNIVRQNRQRPPAVA